MNITLAIKWKYPHLDSLHDFRVEMIDSSLRLVGWYVSNPIQPTSEELQSWWIEYLKAQKLDELNTACEKAICDGFLATNGHSYQFDYKDQDNIGQQLTLLLLDPMISSIQWKTKDVGILVHTREEFIALANDANNHKRSNMGKYWTLEAQLKASTTESEIRSFVW